MIFCIQLISQYYVSGDIASYLFIVHGYGEMPLTLCKQRWQLTVIANTFSIKFKCSWMKKDLGLEVKNLELSSNQKHFLLIRWIVLFAGLLQEGDEILDVNGIDIRGKNVNDVSEMLANMSGTITFMIVPSNTYSSPTPVSPPRTEVVSSCFTILNHRIA